MIKEQTAIESLAETARVWIFQSSVKLDGELEHRIQKNLDDFVADWAAHGAKLMAAAEVRYGWFIVVAVDEKLAAASGCSIDSMMRKIQVIDQDHELALLNRMKVAYRAEQQIRVCDVNEFRQLWSNGVVDENTIVFNHVIETVADLESKWEVPVSESWHRNLQP